MRYLYTWVRGVSLILFVSNAASSAYRQRSYVGVSFLLFGVFIMVSIWNSMFLVLALCSDRGGCSISSLWHLMQIVSMILPDLSFLEFLAAALQLVHVIGVDLSLGLSTLTCISVSPWWLVRLFSLHTLPQASVSLWGTDLLVSRWLTMVL